MTILEFTPSSFIPSRKRKAQLNLRTSIAPRIGWSDGSCSYFSIHNLDGKPPQILVFGDNFSRQTTDQPILPGNFIIETGVFCGKESCPRVHCLPEDKDRVLAVVMKPGTNLGERIF